MKKNRIFIFLIFGIFLISFISAQGCSNEGWKGYSKIYENKTVAITCPTCTFINFTATNSENTIFLDNVQMNKTGNVFSYNFLGEDLNKIGTYRVDGYSNLDLPLGYCFDVTMTGNESSIGSYGILLIICLILFIVLIWINIRFNSEKRKKLYSKIVEGYFRVGNNDERNLGKVILFTLAYGLLRNMLMFYYLLGTLTLFIITELIESFGITSLITLFQTITSIFIWGFILVFIVLFFSIYELIRNLLNDIQKMYLGVSR